MPNFILWEIGFPFSEFEEITEEDFEDLIKTVLPQVSNTIIEGSKITSGSIFLPDGRRVDVSRCS